MTITLRDGDLALTVAPERGAEARSLRIGGVEVLYQAPWSPAPLPAGPVDALPWERAWHGGWQLLWPNAGAPCAVDGVQHGFHGGGSVAAFSVSEEETARVLLRCELGGLVCERGFELSEGRARATARLRNDGAEATPLIVVEHLILGGRLAAEGTTIALDGGRVIGQEWDGTPSAGGQSWPLLGHEDLSVLPATTSQFAVVRDLAAGTARVTAPDGLTLDLRFDHAAFPHLWLWEERFGATVEPWNGRGECLAVEPASVPSTDGLAGAIERGEATQLAPGAVFESWCELIPSWIGDPA
jgi:galactose mutarotase-like enzyme